jgi:hypothetical protein
MMIASRVLKVGGEEGEADLTIRIFAPEQEADAWVCHYEIDWPEGVETKASWGADSIQALLLASSMIGAELYSSSYHKSGRLRLDAPGKGYGFPVPSSLRDLLEGDDAKFF